MTARANPTPVTVGPCTLYLGDALNIVPALQVRADMVFTDPPYGHNNNDGDLIENREAALGKGKAGPKRPIANDGPEANDLFKRCISLLEHVLRRGGCCCCCCCAGGGPDPQFARWSLWLDEVFEFKQMVVWDKGPMGMGWHYRRSCESVLVAQKRGGPCHWCTNRKNVENIIRPGAEGIYKIIPSKRQHPTEKPPELAAHFIRLHSEPGEVVLDPFMGSRSTGVAAVLLGRRFIGIEQDVKWFDNARRRLEAVWARYNRKDGAGTAGGAAVAPGRKGTRNDDCHL